MRKNALFGGSWQLGLHTRQPYNPTWADRRQRVFFIVWDASWMGDVEFLNALQNQIFLCSSSLETQKVL